MGTSHTDGREAADTQKKRMIRAMDVVAVKTLENKDQDDPVTTIPIKFLCNEADANYETVRHTGSFYSIGNHGGCKYERYKGQFRVKARTFLRARSKLDRIEKIRDNSEDHIFNEGGVRAD